NWHSLPPLPLFVSVVLRTDLGWSLLDPAGPAPWMHRSVMLMIALAVMAGLSGAGLAKLLPQQTTWIECGRRLAPVFGGLAALTLLLVLAQEGVHYNPELRRTPMLIWAAVLVAVGLAGMIAGGLALALRPAGDPLGLSERGRALYVYAAELLLV